MDGFEGEIRAFEDSLKKKVSEIDHEKAEKKLVIKLD